MRAERREDDEAAGLGHVGRAADDLLLRRRRESTVTRRSPLRDGCGRVDDDARDDARLGAERRTRAMPSTSIPAAVKRAAIAGASSGS